MQIGVHARIRMHTVRHHHIHFILNIFSADTGKRIPSRRISHNKTACKKLHHRVMFRRRFLPQSCNPIFRVLLTIKKCFVDYNTIAPTLACNIIRASSDVTLPSPFTSAAELRFVVYSCLRQCSLIEMCLATCGKKSLLVDD